MSNQNKKSLPELVAKFTSKENLEILKIEIAELLEKPLKKRELNAIEETLSRTRSNIW
ncbi:hypothetical protein [Rickettsia asembonensis]|uniref:hypothetical protein n=1 Tax=Rickettsia asembonensis TaxID=1068590 RepID=UPI000A4D4B07|nr:hypothetical protein [Rickettsia asembonensis]WCR56414.1 MAG: hypothetical protein PG979_000471 [Rickettsia asembonensis]